MKNIALLKLLHLVSPALPVGAYAYSQGQEYAVDAGWIQNEQQLQHWLAGVMQHSLAYLDLPVLQRCYFAWEQYFFDRKKNSRSIIFWNDILRANRETAELLLEDEQLGMALQRLLVSLDIQAAAISVDAPFSFATLFALAGVHWQIPVRELMLGFAWSWLENQVAAATKTIPLGQTQAQKVLVALTEKVTPVVEKALILSDNDIGLGLPGLALASAKHERQYSRLFRS